MECIRGKRSMSLDRAAFLPLVAPYQDVHLDLGTGDGRYPLRLAPAQPDCFVIGVDACRENLQRPSRVAPNNALFVIANALALPEELAGIASQLSIVFPWGSLLGGLLDANPSLLDGVRMVSRPDASLQVYLNAGALEEQGWELKAGSDRVRHSLREAGFQVDRPHPLDAAALRALPSTWARRLAFGRDPRGMAFGARRVAEVGSVGCREPSLQMVRSSESGLWAGRVVATDFLFD